MTIHFSKILSCQCILRFVFDKGYKDYSYYAELNKKKSIFHSKKNAQFDIAEDCPNNLLKEKHILMSSSLLMKLSSCALNL
jgi:hypothetical protein